MCAQGWQFHKFLHFNHLHHSDLSTFSLAYFRSMIDDVFISYNSVAGRRRV